MLRAVGVALTRVDLEFFEHRVTQRPLGQHTFYGNFKGPAWELILHLSERRLGDATRVAGVTEVFFVFRLIACDANLVGVNDHDEITSIYVGRELCLVFAAQVVG